MSSGNSFHLAQRSCHEGLSKMYKNAFLFKNKYDLTLTDVIHSIPVILQVLVKWYNIYNAPGGPSAHAEWNQFVTCFMTLMGYNTERLTWTRNVSQSRTFTIG